MWWKVFFLHRPTTPLVSEREGCRGDFRCKWKQAVCQERLRFGNLLHGGNMVREKTTFFARCTVTDAIVDEEGLRFKV